MVGHVFLIGDISQFAALGVSCMFLAFGGQLRKRIDTWRHTLEEDRRSQQEKHQKGTEVQQKERHAVAGSGNGYWYWDLSSNEIDFSSSWAKMLGQGIEELQRHPDTWFDLVHPHYLPELKESLSAHLYGRTERFEAKYRIRHRDGTYLWVLNHGVALRGPDGSPIALSGAQIDITQVVDVEKSIVDEAFKDRLTGLANRQGMLVRLQQAVLNAKRGNAGQLALLFLDLDRFKVINDSLGHMTGDQLLAAVASRLRSCVREQRGDMVARFGGDEFVAILEGVPSRRDASDIAERMVKAMREPFLIGQTEIRTGVSIGIALHDPTIHNPEDLLRNADAAMYRAKSSSHAKVAFFNSRMHQDVKRLNQLHNDLPEAIRRGELVLHYQPILSLASGRIKGTEALLRWRHASGELIGPSEFIPIAEETGLIGPIGEWVLREACAQAVRWNDKRMAPLKMSVNVSPLQFLSESLPLLVRGILADTGLHPDRLELELTETAFVSNTPLVTETVHDLTTLGVGISLDDFGTGYASLEQLQRISFQTVKIDRSFVGGLTANSRAGDVAEGLINLIHLVGAEVTAEGVELERQLSILKARSCDQIQGYYASRPVDAPAFVRLLEADFNLYDPLEAARAS
jgi:diguanylate cyclase (GGDEF)-like protein/PAS domain S-box-containing protein